MDEEGKKVKADKEKVAEFRKGLTALGDIYISKTYSYLASSWLIDSLDETSC